MTTISSKDNNNIKYLSKLQTSSKFRREEGKFVSEGLRVCLEALNGNADILSVFVTNEMLNKHNSELEPLIKSAKEIYVITEKLMTFVSDTKTPQGVICILKALDNSIVFDTINNKCIFLENIQDPSNLGTILRTADALGVSSVIMTRDCCDIYSPKVCRGAMGALFRVPFSFTDDAVSFVRKFQKNGTSYAAVVRDAKSISDCSFSGNTLIAIGNEGNGLTPELIEACDHKVTIPMCGNAESLNAAIASGILMWEMMK